MLPGDVIHVDTQTIRFPSERCCGGSPAAWVRRLVLLRRMYSESLAPQDGIALDVPGAVPPGYAGVDGEHSAWERGLWASFWRLASDPAFAAAAGVRVAQGEVVYQRMKPWGSRGGWTWMPSAVSRFWQLHPDATQTGTWLNGQRGANSFTGQRPHSPVCTCNALVRCFDQSLTCRSGDCSAVVQRAIGRTHCRAAPAGNRHRESSDRALLHSGNTWFRRR